MKLNKFWFIIAAVFLIGIAFTMVADNEFYFYATYAVMQLMIMGIAWNILGGFTGYDSISFVRGLTGINFIGFDMVEVMPGYDPAHVTSLLAANIIYEFITLIALSKKNLEQ